MSIINRYLAKDLLQTFLAVLTVLLLIAISSKLANLVSKITSGELSGGLLLKIVYYQLPDLFTFMLPLSLFLAILLSFGRAFVDNELIVLFACGSDWKRLLMMGLAFSSIILCLTAYLNLRVVPSLHHTTAQMLATQEPGLLVDALVKGRFYSFSKDKVVFYVTDLSPNKRVLSQVFVALGTDPKKPWTILTAEKGEIDLHEKEKYAYVKLKDGTRYEGEPGKRDYNIVHFGSYTRLIETKIPPEGFGSNRATPTDILLNSKERGHLAELQWRLSIPLSAPILVLLAVPLSRVSPRAGRYGRLVPAIILFIIYYNFLAMSKRWTAAGIIPVEVGLWWVHGSMLILAFYLNATVSGRARQFYGFIQNTLRYKTPIKT